MKTLHDRIFHVIKEQFADIDKESPFNNVVLVIGNGMTRLAASMDNQSGQSWGAWVYEAARSIDFDNSISLLRLRGYSWDLIFNEIVNQALGNIMLAQNGELIGDPEVAKGVKIYKPLVKYLRKIRKQDFHDVLAIISDAIITTNYDRILEKSEFCEIDESVGPYHSENTETTMKTENTPVYHIHGHLYPYDLEKYFHGLRTWVSEYGIQRTVAFRDTYVKFAIRKSETEFIQHYEKIINSVKSEKTLVLFLGFAFGSEELIFDRILKVAPKSKTIALTFARENDPLLYYKTRGIHTVNIPLGLVASANSRKLALLLFLKHVFDNIVESSDISLKRKSIDDCLLSNNWVETKFPIIKTPHITPIIASIGQMSYNRVYGIEAAMAQESSYQARKSTWKSDGEKMLKPLAAWEIGGQALVPTLIWDLLGLSSSISGFVYDDEIGEKILSRIAKTSQLDFSDVIQLSKGVHREVPNTDNATVTTYFGQRTILDNPRSLQEDTKPKNLPNWPEIIDLKPQFVYATKWGWENLKVKLQSMRRYQPFIISDTGGVGNPFFDKWVADKNGVIIASALSAIRWLYIGDKTKNGDIKQKSEEHRNEWHQIELKDERGRYFQIEHLLNAISTSDRIPTFLSKGALRKAKAYIITIGELGMIYYLKKENVNDWDSPKWCVFNEAFENPKGNILPPSKIINGLGCGDVSRAGFVASLIASINSKVTKEKSLSKMIEWAIGWANFFGMEKVKYFSLEDFFIHLTSLCKDSNLIEKLPDNSIRNIPHNFLDCKIRWVDVFDKNNKLCNALEVWRAYYEEISNLNDRTKFNELIQIWRNERGFM